MIRDVASVATCALAGAAAGIAAFKLMESSSRRAVSSAATARGIACKAATPSPATAGTTAAGKRLTLHCYDHCPYCIRVELTMGFLGLPYDRVVYGYGDASETTGPKKLLGKKVLPVLELEDGSMMMESLDIVAYLDARAGGPAFARLAPQTGRFAEWLARYKPVQRLLYRPRILKMPIVDWTDDAARDVGYARAKYTKQGFDYDAAEAGTADQIKAVNALLGELDALLHPGAAAGGACNAWGPSLDDVTLLPDLRTLTCVAGVAWPAGLRAYMEAAFARPGVHAELYDEHAC